MEPAGRGTEIESTGSQWSQHGSLWCSWGQRARVATSTSQDRPWVLRRRMHLRWHCPLLRLRRRTLNQQQQDDDNDDDDNEGHNDDDRQKHKDEDPADKEHWFTLPTPKAVFSLLLLLPKKHTKHTFYNNISQCFIVIFNGSNKVTLITIAKQKALRGSRVELPCHAKVPAIILSPSPSPRPPGASSSMRTFWSCSRGTIMKCWIFN